MKRTYYIENRELINRVITLGKKCMRTSNRTKIGRHRRGTLELYGIDVNGTGEGWKVDLFFHSRSNYWKGFAIQPFFDYRKLLRLLAFASVPKPEKCP